jgi:SagB-type dehydrogenase family enzyme
MIAQASASRPPVVFNDPRGITALSALPSEFDRETAGRVWTAAAIPPDAHDAVWATFERGGLFEDGAVLDRGSWWEEWGWREARAYHEATRDYPFLQMDEPGAFLADEQRMRAYADEDAPPPVYQSVGDGTTVELFQLPGDESPDVWLAGAGRASDHGQRIGVLLELCFGERGRIGVADGTTCLLKNIPSGGARHPTEVFVAIFDVADLTPGIFHYDVQHHRLEQVRRGQYRPAFADATLDLFLKFAQPPAAALVFTSLVERAMWRYRDPRSFRAILVDVGHAVTAYRRVARLLGFRTYAYQKMNDEPIASLLGIDPVRQPPLYTGTLVP